MGDKHTPGPWHLSASGSFVRKTDKAGWPDWNICEMNMEHDAANANAALVVAAPDLLAACQEAYEQMHGLIRRLSDAGLYGLPEDLHGGKNPKTLMLLREAIGLATG